MKWLRSIEKDTLISEMLGLQEENKKIYQENCNNKSEKEFWQYKYNSLYELHQELRSKLVEYRDKCFELMENQYKLK